MGNKGCALMHQWPKQKVVGKVGTQIWIVICNGIS